MLMNVKHATFVESMQNVTTLKAAINVNANPGIKRLKKRRKVNVATLTNVFLVKILAVLTPIALIWKDLINVYALKATLETLSRAADLLALVLAVVLTLLVKQTAMKQLVSVIMVLLLILKMSLLDVLILMNVILVMGLPDFVDKALYVQTFLEVIIVIVHQALLVTHLDTAKIQTNVAEDMVRMVNAEKKLCVKILWAALPVVVQKVTLEILVKDVQILMNVQKSLAQMESVDFQQSVQICPVHSLVAVRRAV